MRKTGGRHRFAVLVGSGVDWGGPFLGYWVTIQHMEKIADETLVGREWGARTWEGGSGAHWEDWERQ